MRLEVVGETKPILGIVGWQANHSCCICIGTRLDFTIAKGGVLCAYRFDGEPDLERSRLV